MIKYLIAFIFVCVTQQAFAQCVPQRTIDLPTKPDLYGSQYNQSLPLREREIVLTFDDGPSKYTDRLLEILAQFCIKATFFVVGQNVKQYPDVLLRVVAAGHSVGTHSNSHPLLSRMSAKDSRLEILNGIKQVELVIGKKIKPWFRFPFLGHTARDEGFLLGSGISVWSVDIDAHDYEKPGSLVLMDRVMKQLQEKKSGIIILHDIHQESVAFVPMLIKGLRAKQYTFVHVQ